MSTDGAERSPDEKQRGPVVLRRERRNEPTTTDQRLLDSRGPSDWVHTDPWRVLRIQAEFVEGFGSLAEVPRAVTVFGSARTARDHPEYAIGRELGAALGIPAVNYGPGDPNLAHTREEHVDVRRILDAVGVLRRFLT